ncbi:MAG: SDR family NAD(P)-dependent oxidoreductase [Candidatus Sericytochromatia bacterium]|nr:SDR family NAD(P)-dependent oxidoreductase [Candidatus Sericytochromatia bacterium]
MPRSPQTMPPIAVVGVSALFPGSSDAQGFWRDILAARDLIGDVPESHWLVDDYYDPDPSAKDKTYCKRGGFLSAVDFDPVEFGIPPSILPATDTSQLLALLVAKQVLDDATRGQFASMDKERCSVILGVTSGQELFIEMASRLQRPIWVKAMREGGLPESQVQALAEKMADSYVPWQESSFPGLLGNVVAGRIANRFDLGGTNCVTDAACASSLSALAMGINELVLGHSDMVITGGVDTFNDISMYMCFSKTPALSPTGDCRPFSDQADGTILGEGLAMIALKRLEDAERDGDRIYAVLKGLGSSSDGRALSVYAPLSAGQAKALRRAYDSAGYGPDTVELVEAHGTGTKAGDAAEFGGLQMVFDETRRADRQWCALGSVKSQIGHTKATAGAASLFKTIMALHHKVLPPTIKVERPNPKLNLPETAFYINTQARPWVRGKDHPRRASVSSFGFGGSNFHVTFEEYRGSAESAPRMRTLPTELVLLSADSATALLGAAEALLSGEAVEAAQAEGIVRFLAHRTQATYDANKPYRLALVAADALELQGKLTQARETIQAAPDSPFANPAGVYYGVGAAAGPVAFLFPGQGSQYVGMGADLAMAFDRARMVWDQAAAIEMLDPLTGKPSQRLHDVAFPIPVFDDADREAQQARLTATEWAQPALGAASLATLALLRASGLRPASVGGHSFGEVTALAAAGVVEERAALRIARRRGELMAKAAAEGGSPGAMTAVVASAAELRQHTEVWGLPVVVANDNGPRQVVLSGPQEAIVQAEAKLKAAGLRARRLPVATAFHSPLVAPSAKPFADFLAGIEFRPASLPVMSNAEAAAYPKADPEGQRALLASQLAQSVRFVEMIDAMYAAGARVFLEVGPGAVLTGLVSEILKGRPHQAIATDRRGLSGVTALWHALGQLAVAGSSMDYMPLWEGFAVPVDPRARKKPAFALPITGTNYGKVYPPPGGAAALPPPNPEQPERFDPPPTPVSPPVSAPAAAPSVSDPMTHTPSSQDPALTAFAMYQHALAESHQAYLRAMEASLVQTQLAYMRSIEASFQAFGGQPVAPANWAPSLPVMPAMPAVPFAVPPVPPEAWAAHVAPPAVAASPSVVSPGGVAASLPAAAVAPASPPAAVAPAPTPERVVPPAVAAPALPVAAVSPSPALPAAPPAAAPAAAAPVAAPLPDLEGLMLAVVADKTGYPVEMLELGMALEADLGIDSIKRVEILGAVQERVPGLPEFDAGEMSAMKTLGEIVDFMRRGLGGSPAVAPAAVAGLQVTTDLPAAPLPAADGAAVAAPGPDLEGLMLQVVAEKTGYPVEMLELGMALEADLGIDSIKRVEILGAVQERVPSLPEFDAGEMAALKTLGEIVAFMRRGLAGSGAAPAAVASAPASPPVSAAPAAGSSAHSAEAIAALMLAVVAEKTGYPVEMLNLDMALEADLGIDSIKRVEILGAVQERLPGLPEFDAGEMAALKTLGQIVSHIERLLGGGAPDPGPGSGSAAPALTPAALDATVGLASPAEVRTLVPQASVSPPEALAPPPDLPPLEQTPRGADTPPAVTLQSPDTPVSGPSAEEASEPAEAQALASVSPPKAAKSRAKRASHGAGDASPFGSAFRAGQGGLRQVLRLEDVAPGGDRLEVSGTALVAPGQAPRELADALVAALGRQGIEASVGEEPGEDTGLVICLQALTDQAGPETAAALHRDVLAIARAVAPRFAKQGGVFVTVQNTGGDFGLGGQIGEQAWLAGLTGLVKTAAHEWPEAHCKAIDLWEPGASPKAVAERLVDEILLGGPDLEVGLQRDGQRFVPVLAHADADVVAVAPWIDQNSVVLASGGARGVTAVALEALARACKPKIVLLGRSPLIDEPEAVKGLKEGAEMKRALLELARAEGRPLTPAELGRQVSQITAAREVRDTLKALRRAGSEALYLEFDVRDKTQVEAALAPIRQAYGPITAIVHGAGVLADKFIADLTPDQFDRVFETKVGGLRALLAATADDPITAICMFSSIAARTGNVGQAAYAMANEVLNKVAQAEAARRGNHCLVKSLNWGPWAGGMVTPELKAHFEKQGVPLIPLAMGAQMFVDEFRVAEPGDVEIVLAGPAEGASPDPSTHLSVLLDHRSHPQMDGHRIQDSPVLPVVQVLDWFIRAAVDTRPDLVFSALKDLKVLKGVPLERYHVGGDRFTVRCNEAGQALLTEIEMELRSDDGPPFYRGTAILTNPANRLAPLPPLLPLELEACTWSHDEMYGAMLFHGPSFQVLRTIEGVSRDGMAATMVGLTEQGWPEGSYQTDVAALDGGLQLARLWGYHMAKRPSLPTSIAEFRRYVPGPTEGPLRVELRGRSVTKHRTLSDIRFATLDGSLVADMRGVEMHFLPERKQPVSAAAGEPVGA